MYVIYNFIYYTPTNNHRFFLSILAFFLSFSIFFCFWLIVEMEVNERDGQWYSIYLWKSRNVFISWFDGHFPATFLFFDGQSLHFWLECCCFFRFFFWFDLVERNPKSRNWEIEKSRNLFTFIEWLRDRIFCHQMTSSGNIFEGISGIVTMMGNWEARRSSTQETWLAKEWWDTKSFS